MAQYNEALAGAAQAEKRGDEVTAADFDAEASRIYALIVSANEEQAEIIEEAEDDVLGMPLYAFIIGVAVIFIGLVLVLILVIRCCKKMKADDGNIIKV
jgi:Fe2+ transport system protein B